MRRIFTYTVSWILTIALAISLNCAFASGPHKIKVPAKDTLNYLLGTKKPKKKSFLNLSFPPIKAGLFSSAKVNVQQPSDKLLSNVSVYPNPTSEQINLKYNVSRYSTVSAKLVDILGNNVATLVPQQMFEPGEYTKTYALNSKISKGFYYVKIVAGTESAIVKIAIL